MLGSKTIVVRWLLITCLVITFCGRIFAATEQSVEEILSVRPGPGSGQIENRILREREPIPVDPLVRSYPGFVVTSTGRIFVADPFKGQVLGFSRNGAVEVLIRGIVPGAKTPPFRPAEICLDEEDGVPVKAVSNEN